MEFRLQIIDDKGNIVRSKELDAGLQEIADDITVLSTAVAHLTWVIESMKSIQTKSPEFARLIKLAEIKDYPFKEQP